MTIPELLFGMGFGLLSLSFLIFAAKEDDRWLGLALILTSLYLFHEGFGDRLLPPPNEVAIATMATVAIFCLWSGVLLLTRAWVRAWLKSR